MTAAQDAHQIAAALAPRAVQTLGQLLDDTIPAATRLGAARAILAVAGVQDATDPDCELHVQIVED